MERVKRSLYTKARENLLPRGQIISTNLAQQLPTERVRKTASRTNGSGTRGSSRPTDLKSNKSFFSHKKFPKMMVKKGPFDRQMQNLCVHF